jgi:hypothetical protein
MFWPVARMATTAITARMQSSRMNVRIGIASHALKLKASESASGASSPSSPVALNHRRNVKRNRSTALAPAIMSPKRSLVVSTAM